LSTASQVDKTNNCAADGPEKLTAAPLHRYIDLLESSVSAISSFFLIAKQIPVGRPASDRDDFGARDGCTG